MTASPGTRRRVAAVAALLLAIVAAIAWLAWDSAANLGPAASPSPPVAAQARAATERNAHDASGEAQRSGATAAERTAAPPSLAGLRATVLVVLEETQEPAAGATLWYLPPRTKTGHDLDERRIDEDRDPESYLQALGEAATTDEQGRADVVLDAKRVVCARLGDRYGETWVGGDTDDAPIVVELQHDVALRVEVVDDTGRPCAGLCVDMWGEAVSRRGGRASFSASLAATDVLGSTTLPHLQCCAPLPGPDVMAFSMVLKCDCSSASQPERAVSAGEVLGNVPVRIVVPSGGEVHVRVVDADGRPHRRQIPVLRAVDEDNTRMPASGCAGEWRFAPVPPGRRWVAAIHDGSVTTSIEFDGPLQAVDTPVAVELHFPGREWRLQGRLLQDGVPLAGAWVTLVGSPSGNAASGPPKHWTDERGGFSFRGAMSSDLGACEVSLLVEHPWLPKDTRVACATKLAPGDVDLGDVAVPPLAFDRPLVVVRVQAEGRDITATSSVTMHSREAERPGQVQDVPARARTTERGIELWGPAPLGAVDVRVQALGHVSKSVEVRLHDAVTVELERAAELWASIVPPVVPPETLNVLLVAEGLAVARGLGASGARTHQLNWPFQLPGRYRIAVEVCNTVVYESELFDLVAGMNRWPVDGSLRDLRNAAKVAHLAVVDADTGVPVAKPRLHTVRRYATDEGEREEAIELGEWFLAAPNAADVLATAAGYEPVRLVRPLGDQRIHLRRMTTVRVLVAPGATDTGVHIVEDAVRDALLCSVDEHPHSEHGSYCGEPSFELQFAAGTVLEFTSAIGGVRGTPQRVVVGTTSPQEVQLR